MSKILLAIFTVITITMFLAGCPKKQTVFSESAVVSSEAKEEAVAKAQAEAAEKARVEADAKAKDEAKAEKEAEEKAKIEAEEEAKADAIKAFQAEDIHFDLDRYDIKEGDREILKSLAEWLLDNKNMKVEIEGHCDERGADEYNLALGDRRAHSVMQYMTMLGVTSERISATTYGEEKPLCTEPTEDCWWRNRRAHFSIQQG